MKDEHEASWAAEEFAEINLGDKRLNARLVKLCNRFSDAPESPINQACADWAETKAAYRFFQNENAEVGQILATHRCKTAQRAKKHKMVLAVQDTSYFVYTSHRKTEGLGKLSLMKGKNIDKIYSNGLVVHTCLAVTREGLPLGLLDQKIFSRKLRPEKARRSKSSQPHDNLPVEEKESYRWLEALAKTKEAMGDSGIITVCDREADLYDFFKLSHQIGSPVLVRASANRTINRNSRYKVLWYCLRWRIEMYFKVLKSGFRIEECRLGRADRLARYLTVMSIVAWRLFMITLIARTDPAAPCSALLADHEWKVLFLKVNKNKPLPKKPPPIGDVVIWIAKLGGYLARKSDGPPGTIALWRGWKRLADLTEGWNLAVQE